MHTKHKYFILTFAEQLANILKQIKTYPFVYIDALCACRMLISATKRKLVLIKCIKLITKIKKTLLISKSKTCSLFKNQQTHP